MINGLEGIPGSGKSYEGTVYHVLPQLKAGRLVITNLPLVVEMFAAIDPSYVDLIELRTKPQPIRGSWDAQGIDDKGNGQAFKLVEHDGVYEPEISSEIEATKYAARRKPLAGKNPVFGQVWDYYTTWKHPVTGQGPLFIIDECHNPLPSIGTSEEVVEWFKLHRHFNVDVLLLTQNFRDMNQPIARLIGMLIKCRKGDILGKPKSYIRKVHSGYRGAVISVEERKYLPQYFVLYRSHTQGNSVSESLASDVVPLSIKLRRFTWAFWAVTIVFGIWAFWPKDKAFLPGGKPSNTQPKVIAQQKPASAPVSPVPVVDALPAPVQPPPDLEPLKDKLVHITGQIVNSKGAMQIFAVSAGGVAQFTVLARDLEAAGYTWQAVAPCIGFLKFEKKVRTITCDAPVVAAGSQSAPVVVDFSSGKSNAELVRPRS